VLQGKNVFPSAFFWCWFMFLWYSASERCASEDAYCPEKGLPALQV